MNADIAAIAYAVEVVNEVHQFFIIGFIIIIWDYRNAVIKLVAETVNGVVDYNNILKFSIFENS